MSVKSKLQWPTSGDHLVKVSSIRQWQKYMGGQMVYGATVPGRKVTGTKTLRLQVKGARCPYYWVRFRYNTIASGTPGQSSWQYNEGTDTLVQYNANFPRGGLAIEQDAFHIAQGRRNVGRVGNAVVWANTAYQDPDEIRLTFSMDTQNGSNFDQFVKDVVVGGCYEYAGAGDYPLLTSDGGVNRELLSNSHMLDLSQRLAAEQPDLAAFIHRQEAKSGTADTELNRLLDDIPKTLLVCRRSETRVISTTATAFPSTPDLRVRVSPWTGNYCALQVGLRTATGGNNVRCKFEIEAPIGTKTSVAELLTTSTTTAYQRSVADLSSLGGSDRRGEEGYLNIYLRCEGAGSETGYLEGLSAFQCPSNTDANILWW